jgi:hypothetical protein
VFLSLISAESIVVLELIGTSTFMDMSALCLSNSIGSSVGSYIAEKPQQHTPDRVQFRKTKGSWPEIEKGEHIISF